VVLDELGLVEHESPPGTSLELGHVDPQDRIRRDDDVGGLRHLGERHPTLCRRLRNDRDPQSRGELRRFPDPGAEHAGRGDDEQRVGEVAVLLGALGHGEDLQGLAEAHVVGEDAAESQRPQLTEPLVALDLIGPQLGGEARG